MSLATLHSRALVGLQALPVTVEVHLAPGSAFIRGRISADDGTLVALTSARFALFDASRAQGGNVAPLATAPASPVVAELGGWDSSPADDLLGLSLVRLHPAGGIDVHRDSFKKR